MSASVNTNALQILRDLGNELRNVRLAAGFASQVLAAKKLKCSQNKVSYIERGKRWPDDALLRRMFDLYGVEEPKRAEIKALIRAGKSIRKSWWEASEYREVFSGASMQLFPLEDAAERSLTHSGTYIPGLLQTRAYTTALVSFGQKDESARHREIFIDTRMKRQDVLTRQRPLILHATFLEAALRAVVGGPEVMREQLAQMRSAARRPNITLRVIPFAAGGPATLGAPFTLLDFPGPADNRSVAIRETSHSDEIMEEVATVRAMRRRFADLTKHAHSPEGTVHLIEEIEKELS
ncbi:helix-turn-helix domain-containing protein [Streptomyces johnsoniae]|uniref:Helix-turn-helix transcriptional regulator n=1 Tax=Streptomyces johnsoniae TaxID=3075532 RepID=A0ABU2SEC4_9ACTN|nr:helix-turn-helix transcriptional regulator [Streptomyces sp. DSM 41886]MDT0447321.1 helix-turn-helix transcriptional regulator [Streptomyces sp. DSM 41886]